MKAENHNLKIVEILNFLENTVSTDSLRPDVIGVFRADNSLVWYSIEVDSKQDRTRRLIAYLGQNRIRYVFCVNLTFKFVKIVCLFNERDKPLPLPVLDIARRLRERLLNGEGQIKQTFLSMEVKPNG